MAVLVSVGALTACERDIGPGPMEYPKPVSEPTVDVEHAQQRYHPLMAAVAAAVADVSVPGRSDGNPESIYYGGVREETYYAGPQGCTYSSLQYEFDTVFGESDSASWDDVRAAVAGVLEPEGFEVTGQLDIPGGNNGFDAATDDGTRLKVRSKLGSPSTVSLDAPVLGGCQREGSESLPHLPS